ncbi:hypothetical protein N0V95_002888 [Ascochyta clinopodiicola]|nr:hypothetical protein N0V95_002888 [Ascochyta clinopodiicola]
MDLLTQYLAHPASRREAFFTSLSEADQRRLLEILFGHHTTSALASEPSVLAQDGQVISSPNTTARETRASNLNRLIDENNLNIETVLVAYDEYLHYYDPQETGVDRMFQEVASELSANGQQSPSIEECRHTSQSLVQDVIGYFEYLNTTLLHYEAPIRTQWRKYSRASRQDVLLAAWPNMAKNHRADIAPYMSTSGTSTDDMFKTSTWPYINLEDLLQPKALLIFLHSRGRHHPDNFAYFDLEMAPLYRMRKELLDLRKDCSTMAFLGRKSRSDYGQLVEWASAEEQSESLRSGRTVHVDHGIQILIIQKGILEFLSQCVSLIIQDIIIQKNSSNIVAVQSELSDLSDNTECYSQLSIVAREAPYRLPTKLDLTRLEVMTCAQKRQAIDHAWSLREDPAYFADAVEQKRSHRIELIQDLAGDVHEHAKDFPLYNKALRHLIMDACFSVFFWDHVSKSLTGLREMASKYADDIRLDRDLPADFFMALAEARFFLESYSLDLISMLKTFFPASPPLRDYFYRANPHDANKLVSAVLPRQDTYSIHGKTLRHLMRLIEMMNNKGSRKLLTLHSILDELERFMQNDSDAKALVSPFMASLISQLSVVAECLHQLHSFQPWALKVESEIDKHRMAFSNRYDALLRHWTRIDLAHQSFLKRELCRLGNPRDGKFDYPVHERHSQKKVLKMRASEAALDAFWGAANAHWLQVAGTTPGALIEDIVGERVLYRTPVWVEPSKPGKPTIKLPISNGPVEPFSAHVHDESKQITGSFQRMSFSTRHKQKTRRPVALEQEPSASPARTQSPDPATIYTVDKRSMKVFKTLFHSPESQDQPGEVTWPNFLHAMVSVGFGAEKLQGSAWHFTPATLAAERSIQFHEPHPGNKLPFKWARGYGRRLTRAFGWTGASFSLA